MRVWREGRGGRDTLHMPSLHHGGHTIPWYIGDSLFPGTPQPAHGRTGWSAQRCMPAGGTVTAREALIGETPWVGAFPAPLDPKVVNVGVSSVRRSFRVN